jgi:type III restriction enzyme
MPYKSLKFQNDAIQALKRVIFEQWTNDNNNQPIVFKSPTGSGKTLMMAELVKTLVYDREWSEDVAYIWISFSPESAMQSKTKFAQYYDGNSQIKLLDLEVLGQKELGQNEVIFVNWQKLKANNKDGRKARKDQPEQYKLSFDNLMANTHKADRKVVLLIDEAHIQTGSHLALTAELLEVIKPKISIHITATPDANIELEARQNDTFVQVKREEVVKAELIKESLVVMPEEKINKILEARKALGQTLDLDVLLLELAIEKKLELEQAYKAVGKNINPLILIQLPNDDKASKERGEESKEDFVRNYLANKNIDPNRVATWLSGSQINLDGITNNYSHIDYLIFKEAPATGWDCPRASVLVMYRDIKKDSFRTQIIGRILRMPESCHYNDTQLNTGYIYTNYQRQEIKEIPDLGTNKPKTQFSTFKTGLKNVKLKSVFFNRIDYNALEQDFQSVFIKTANEYFGLTGSLEEGVNATVTNKVTNKGLSLDNFDNLQIQMIVNAKISDFDYFGRELKAKGENKNYELSGNDLQRMFDLLCYKAIGGQQEEARKFAPVKSFGILKSALRVWFSQNLKELQSQWYKIICNDLLKEDSTFSKIIGLALQNYRSIHIQKVKSKSNKLKDEFEWSVPQNRAFTEEYIELNPQPKLSATMPFLVQPTYRGKQNEEKFIKFLEEQTDKIDWWYKNGDKGREHLAICYTDSQTQTEEAFYVDWIVRFKSGDLVGLYDTKGGTTAKEGEVKDKAEWLQKYILKQNSNQEKTQNLQGGIVIDSSGWKLQNKEEYKYIPKNLTQSSWVDLEF